MRILLLFVGASALALLMTMPAGAETPGRHPHYLRARTDLRTAELYLRGRAEPNAETHLRAAQEEIGKAIHEIDNASVIDAKNLNDHPHVDTHLDRIGRFRNVMHLLDSARRDLAKEEDNPAALGWRDAAFRHIDAATGHLHAAAQAMQIDRQMGY